MQALWNSPPYGKAQELSVHNAQVASTGVAVAVQLELQKAEGTVPVALTVSVNEQGELPPVGKAPGSSLSGKGWQAPTASFVGPKTVVAPLTVVSVTVTPFRSVFPVLQTVPETVMCTLSVELFVCRQAAQCFVSVSPFVTVNGHSV